MVAPPVLALWVLRGCVPSAELEFVEGDFFEEFADVHGRAPRSTAAILWALRYALSSVVPFVQMRIRRVPMATLLAGQLGALVFAGLAYGALRALRIYVLVHVPLRAADHPTIGYVVAETLIVIVMGILGAVATHHLYIDIKKGKPQ